VLLSCLQGKCYKTFLCPRFTDFHTKIERLFRLDWKKLTNDKHSSLLRKSVIYGQKSFITLGPGDVILTQLACPLNDVIFCLHTE
jgi:hypothetical protein